MTTSDKVETKINIYNTVRNFCLNYMWNTENPYQQECYKDIIGMIDNKMKDENIEHYVFMMKL